VPEISKLQEAREGLGGASDSAFCSPSIEAKSFDCDIAVIELEALEIASQKYSEYSMSKRRAKISQRNFLFSRI
jgi:hypothetical protein